MIFADGNKLCSRCKFFVRKDGSIGNLGNFADESEAAAALGAPVVTTPESEGKPTKEPAAKTMSMKIEAKGTSDVLSLPTGESDRGIKGSVMRKFNIRFEFDPGDRSIAKHYYPITEDRKLISWKARDCPTKTFTFTKPTKGHTLDFFGMMAYSKFKGMNLVITEGECDALAAYQMLDGKVVDLMVLSLPTGANAKSICDHLEFLQDQASVTLCYDQDEAGNKAEEETWKLLPPIKVMRMSEKDANDMLLKKKSAEFHSSYTHADAFKPKVLATIGSMDNSEVVAPIEWGLSYPWDAMTKMTYGIQMNQVIGIGAAPGAGKTTLVRGIQQHLMYHHKEKIGIFSLEEKPEWTTRLITGYIMNKPIHVPDCVYSVKDAEKIKKDLENRAYFYEHKYYEGDWLEIESHIRYLHVAQGVRFFFIDPLSALVAHLTPSEANKFLSEAMYRLSKMVQQMDITVFHVNHLNPASDGKSHEAGARVYSSQFTGSRAQWRYSHSLFGAERDQLADDGTENDCIIRFLKDRAYGNTGKTATLKYNQLTGRLEDVKVKF